MNVATPEQAEQAIWKAIEDLAKKAGEHGATTRSAMVRDAAYAWRAMVGGQQPGGLVMKD